MRIFILLIIFSFVYTSSSAQDTDFVLKAEIITIEKHRELSVVDSKAELIENVSGKGLQNNESTFQPIILKLEKTYILTRGIELKAKLMPSENLKSSKKMIKPKTIEITLKRQSEPVEIMASAVQIKRINDFNSDSKN